MPYIETVFKANNGSKGIMFSVTAKKNITITELWSAFRIKGTQNVDIYVRDGGHAKGEAGWVKIKSGALAYVLNVGEGSITRIATTLAVDIKAGETKGFAITTPTVSAIGYSSSSTDFSNDDATIVNGVGFSTLGTYFNYPRILNGRVVYNLTKEPPTEPSLTKQPISKSMNLSNEIVSLEWTASTDSEGNPITYEIDLYNGSTWASIAKNIMDTNYDCILPSVTTDKAQLRIRATDSENSASEYTLSNVFSVAKQLYVIKDGNTNKSYKNGNWEFI
ncbi:hypothetical protein [Bacillus toyonensis]|uniref:hypothetical protein n=1 Tax=Bacillus toyonensis TaxID=155322 RepID=UPI0020D276EC|nr:hypothetical protein [Bacillus toyonensis]